MSKTQHNHKANIMSCSYCDRTSTVRRIIINESCEVTRNKIKQMKACNQVFFCYLERTKRK